MQFSTQNRGAIGDGGVQQQRWCSVNVRRLQTGQKQCAKEEKERTEKCLTKGKKYFKGFWNWVKASKGRRRRPAAMPSTAPVGTCDVRRGLERRSTGPGGPATLRRRCDLTGFYTFMNKIVIYTVPNLTKWHQEVTRQVLQFWTYNLLVLLVNFNLISFSKWFTFKFLVSKKKSRH